MATATLNELTAEMEKIEAEEKRIEAERQRLADLAARREELRQEFEARQGKANELRNQLEKLVGERKAIEDRLMTEGSRIDEAMEELRKQLESMEGVVRRRGPGRPKGSKNKNRRSTISSATATGQPRRRGRPKGSKNKPKVETSDTTEVAESHSVRGRSLNDRPAIEFVIEVLQKAGQSLNLADIYESAKAMGFQTTRGDGDEKGAHNALYTAVWEENRRAKEANETPRVVKESTPNGILYSLG